MSAAAGPAAGLTAARRVADAILYEGYLLYPYRASAAKNQLRWQFGVLGPHGAAEAGVGEEPTMWADVLVAPAVDQPGEPTLDVTLRFLQVQCREIERLDGRRWVQVPELVVAGTRWIPYHEAVPRDVHLTGISVAPGAFRRLAVSVPAGRDVEELRENGRVVGRLVRSRWALSGTVTLSPRAGIDRRVIVLSIGIDNDARWSTSVHAGWSPRDVAARTSFVGTHLLITATGAMLPSLLDPPRWAQPDAADCGQHRCWPGIPTQAQS